MKKNIQPSERLKLTLLMAKNGFEVDPNLPMGRQSAGASFLEAYLKYSGNKTHHIAINKRETGSWFHSKARAINASASTHAVPLHAWGNAAKINGSFHSPDPLIEEWAWRRMPWGDGSFSIIGQVHTLCSYKVQRSLGQITTSPTRHWDALICTSQAAKSVVTGFLERQEDWIRHHLKASGQFERPQLPIIPLGIHPQDWNPPRDKATEQKEARKALKIRQEAQIVLIAGRVDFLTKFQPAPLLRSLQELRNTRFPNLELLIYGEAPNENMRHLLRKGIKQLAPTLNIHWVDGKIFKLANLVRWASDVFVSLADNPQETFGITPLEAMAAELPCIVSDWNGYRDTITQPDESPEATGYRIKTQIIENLGEEESNLMLQNSIKYSHAVGRIANGVSIDMDDFKAKLTELLLSSDQRTAMGQAGRRRVAERYDWKSVMNEWRMLLDELGERRRHGQENHSFNKPQLPAWMPNTAVGFGSFASEIISEDLITRTPEHKDELHSLNNTLQSWDKSLLESNSPRRKGWWLKQGLINLQ